MAPIIHCVRHGQGLHNVGAGCYTLHDPNLTPLGVEQCEALRETLFSDQSRISLVAASPLCRALHTASVVFRPALTLNSKCPPQIIALPDAQETSDDMCDTGSAPSVLRVTAAENGWPVDLSRVADGWNVKTLGGRYSPRSDAIQARAKDARLLLRQMVRELVKGGDVDAEVVLVAHGGFMHYFADDWEDAHLFPGTGWHNCETRSYTFEQDFLTEEDAEARLVETMESRRRRGKRHAMYGRGEQLKLFRLAMESWGNQGLQRPDTL